MSLLTDFTASSRRFLALATLMLSLGGAAWAAADTDPGAKAEDDTARGDGVAETTDTKRVTVRFSRLSDDEADRWRSRLRGWLVGSRETRPAKPLQPVPAPAEKDLKLRWDGRLLHIITLGLGEPGDRGPHCSLPPKEIPLLSQDSGEVRGEDGP